jgi:hypothetical protein
MVNRIIIVALFSLCFSSTAIANDMELPLDWRPANIMSKYNNIDIGKLAVVKVKVNPIQDERENKKEVGKNVEKPEPKLYVTKDDVAAWSFDRFQHVLKQFGVDVVTENPDVTLDVKLIRFYVTEKQTYQGTVAFKIAVKSTKSESIWVGTVSGQTNRWGRSFSSANFYEAMSSSFIEAVYNFVTNQSLLAALK